ncbi:GNAT family N-acetyltransferase [Fodinicurvata sediminis]
MTALVAGQPAHRAVAIDPDVRNLRAHHACLSAGFRDWGQVKPLTIARS